MVFMALEDWESATNQVAHHGGLIFGEVVCLDCVYHFLVCLGRGVVRLQDGDAFLGVEGDRQVHVAVF